MKLGVERHCHGDQFCIEVPIPGSHAHTVTEDYLINYKLSSQTSCTDVLSHDVAIIKYDPAVVTRYKAQMYYISDLLPNQLLIN